MLPRTLNELEKIYTQVCNLPINPDNEVFHYYPIGTVIDEDKSVKWNREYVETENKRYEEEIKRLRNIKNETVQKVIEEICESISFEIAHGFTKEKAEYIFDRANDRASTITDLFLYIDDYINFVLNIL